MSKKPTRRPTTPTAIKANPYRGQTKAILNDREVLFCIDLGALGDLSVSLGIKNNVLLFQRMQGEMMDRGDGVMVPTGPAVQDLPIIIQALTNGAVTIEEARTFGFADMRAAGDAIARATALSSPEENPEKKVNGDAEANSETTSHSTNGSASPGA